jgi:hypothetical protein
MLSTVLMKLLTVKTIATAAAVTTVAGGVAAAAVTMDAKPDVLQVASQAGVEASPSTAVRGAKKHDGANGKDGKDGRKAGADGTGPAGAAGSPSPSLVGLCHAVNSGNKAEHGKALQSPAFRVLVTTAGGADRVDAFCTALLVRDDKSAKVDPSTPATADDSTGGGASGDDRPGNGKPDTAGSGRPNSDKANTDKAGSGIDKSGNGRPTATLSDVPAGP